MIRFLTLFVLICFTSCSKKQDTISTQQIRLGIESEPASLDPRVARDLASINLIHCMFEGLTRISAEGAVELAAADKLDVSEDGLKYTFHLRRAKWSDGTAVTSSDFASSWRAILSPRFASDVAYHLYPIQNGRHVKMGKLPLESLGIATPDAETLVVVLQEKIPYFLELLAMTPFFPTCEKASSQWAMQSGSYISNGPFRMSGWRHSDAITLEKNPFYWGADQVRLTQVEFLVMAADTALRMFEEGKLDWVGSPLATLPPDAIGPLKEQGLLQAHPFLATSFLRVNTSKTLGGKSNPLAHPLLRKALSLSVDRSGIVSNILQGGQKAAQALVPPELGLSKAGEVDESLTVDTAKLMEQVQAEMGEIGPIVLSYANNPRNAAIAQALQREWEEKLHIFVQLEGAEFKSYFQRVSKQEFQLALGSWTADFSDPVNFLEVFKYKDNGTNNTCWENQNYIDLLNQSQLCKSSEERLQLLKEAEAILMDQMPLIPIYHYALNYLVRENLEGVVVSPLGSIDLRLGQLKD